MSEMIRVLGRVATVAQARVLAVQRGDAPATLKWFPGSASRPRALAEADLRTTVRVAGLAPCRSLIDLDGGVALLLDGEAGTSVSLLSRAAPMPPRAALELVAAVGEVLLALDESGGVWGMLQPEDVAVTAEGAVNLLDPGSGPRADEAADGRALTWRLGGLLFSLATGRTYPMRAGMPFAREVTVGRHLVARGVSAEMSGLIRRLLVGAAQTRPWPEEAIVLARALAIALDGPDLRAWSRTQRTPLRDPMAGRLVSLEVQPAAVVLRPPEARDEIEVLFEDLGTPDDDASTDLVASAEAAAAQESSEDEDTPEDARRPHGLLVALDEATQPFEPMDDLDDAVLDDSGTPAHEPPQSRARFWSLFGLR